jgi:hypothetical protein
MTSLMKAVMSAIEDRRRAQNARWGDVDQQLDRPIGGETSLARERDLIKARLVKEGKERAGTLTWMDILKEEFLELAAEPDDSWPRQRREAIDVAAVAVAMVEAGDLRAQKAKDAAGADTSESESSQLP